MLWNRQDVMRELHEVDARIETRKRIFDRVYARQSIVRRQRAWRAFLADPGLRSLLARREQLSQILKGRKVYGR